MDCVYTHEIEKTSLLCRQPLQRYAARGGGLGPMQQIVCDERDIDKLPVSMDMHTT